MSSVAQNLGRKLLPHAEVRTAGEVTGDLCGTGWQQNILLKI